ncbi:MAG: alpha/beta fold hydrolase [Aquiluna sp.]|nr:alpha/beta fold hydrolase [Aquiluna sp.]
MEEIRSSTVLPATRSAVELITLDGQKLVGELSVPVNGEPKATLIMLHPLPTHGGFMDSHLIRKASNRLPALIGVAVLRFNTRGTSSPQGTSTGNFEEGVGEAADVAAAVAFCSQQGLPTPWLVGWSFGTELALKYGPDHHIQGAILLSPPLHRATEMDLMRWNEFKKPLIALVPELDEFLDPAAAKIRFSVVAHAEVTGYDQEKHLWVGENATRRVLDKVAEVTVPGSSPLPRSY